MEGHWLQFGVVFLTMASFGLCCEPWEFPCYNKECIRHSGRCDGKPQCSDSSDEISCPTIVLTTSTTGLPEHYRPCFDGNFQCLNGRCIYKHWHCDGQDDCGDLSDETGCGGEVEPKQGTSNLLDTESIIGIAIALVAVALLVAGITAFVLYYRKKFLNDDRNEHPRHVSDILEPIPVNLPYNFPREALLREPPPRYTSQQDVNISHDNAGYHDDELFRPPPYYSSNPDLQRNVSACEPPPSYSSRQDLTNLDCSLVENRPPGQLDVSSEAPPRNIHTVLSHSTDSLGKLNMSKDSSFENDSKDEWHGSQWKGLPKAVRKQKQVSASDSHLANGYLLHPVPQEKPVCTSQMTHRGDQNLIQGGSMSSSKIMTISSYVEQSQKPTALGKWRQENLRGESQQTTPDVTVSQPLPTQLSASCSVSEHDDQMTGKTRSSPSLQLRVSHDMIGINLPKSSNSAWAPNSSNNSYFTVFNNTKPNSLEYFGSRPSLRSADDSCSSDLINRLSCVNEIDEEPQSQTTVMNDLDQNVIDLSLGAPSKSLKFRSQSLPILMSDCETFVYTNARGSEC